jgi:hypothetical protein
LSYVMNEILYLIFYVYSYIQRMSLGSKLLGDEGEKFEESVDTDVAPNSIDVDEMTESSSDCTVRANISSLSGPSQISEPIETQMPITVPENSNTISISATRPLISNLPGHVISLEEVNATMQEVNAILENTESSFDRYMQVQQAGERGRLRVDSLQQQQQQNVDPESEFEVG